MSVDLLRRAATHLRERAEAASPGPWNTHSHGYKDTPDDTTWELHTANLDDAVGYTVVAETTATGPTQRQEAEHDFTYLALMHPPVAHALAACMDKVAWMVEFDAHLIARVGVDELIGVARAILRQEEP